MDLERLSTKEWGFLLQQRSKKEESFVGCTIETRIAADITYILREKYPFL